jgi:hypothetical protein
MRDKINAYLNKGEGKTHAPFKPDSSIIFGGFLLLLLQVYPDFPAPRPPKGNFMEIRFRLFWLSIPHLVAFIRGNKFVRQRSSGINRRGYSNRAGIRNDRFRRFNLRGSRYHFRRPLRQVLL